MPYSPTNFVNGSTPLSAANMNLLGTQYSEATQSFERDLFTPFVYTGIVSSADGTIANQLDVTAGTAFLLQTDLTLRRRAVIASTTGQFTTSTPSTTYYLFLNNDGTWTWGTTSIGPTNSLAICQVTTNVSGNITAVTDVRTLTTSLFLNSGVLSTLVLAAGKIFKTQNTASGGGVTGKYELSDPDNTTLYFDLLADKLRIVSNYQGGSAVVLLTLAAQSGAITFDNGKIVTDGLGTFSGNGTAAPGAPTLALATGTVLGIGVYNYKATYVTALGESALGTLATITTTNGNQDVNLSAIPVSASIAVTKRNIYRTKVGGSTYYLLTTINDNTTTTYADTTADTSLTTVAPAHPSLGGDIWKNSVGTIVAQIFGDGAIMDVSGRVAVQGGQSLGQPALSYGSGVPGSLAVNEIYVQIS